MGKELHLAPLIIPLMFANEKSIRHESGAASPNQNSVSLIRPDDGAQGSFYCGSGGRQRGDWGESLRHTAGPQGYQAFVVRGRNTPLKDWGEGKKVNYTGKPEGCREAPVEAGLVGGG